MTFLFFAVAKKEKEETVSVIVRRMRDSIFIRLNSEKKLIIIKKELCCEVQISN
tara:strand:- start:312 stop:473 length:162 start_codon:yes stop_codon:yes gene_type:complete